MIWKLLLPQEDINTMSNQLPTVIQPQKICTAHSRAWFSADFPCYVNMKNLRRCLVCHQMTAVSKITNQTLIKMIITRVQILAAWTNLTLFMQTRPLNHQWDKATCTLQRTHRMKAAITIKQLKKIIRLPNFCLAIDPLLERQLRPQILAFTGTLSIMMSITCLR